MKLRPLAITKILIAVMTIGALPAGAQTTVPKKAQAPAADVPAKEPPPVGSNPTMTTATFGDWVLRCVSIDANGVAKSCELLQSIVVQGQAAPLAQIAIGHPAPSAPKENLRITVVLPSNVTLTAVPKVLAYDEDKQGLDTVWQRCLPSGCFASAPVSDDRLARWRSASKPGAILFADAIGQQIKLPLSFRGLQQAINQLSNVERPTPSSD